MKRCLVFGLLALAACAAPTRGAAPTAHPLDPLSAAEIERAAGILRAAPGFAEGMRFPSLALKEPSKTALRAGSTSTREAAAVLLDRRSRKTIEAVVDLTAGRLASWTEIPGAHPGVLVEEFETVPEIVKADPAWRAAVAKRGIPDVSKVHVDTWAAGVLPVEGAAPGARLCRAIAFYRGDAENVYGTPIEGLVAVVDVGLGKVVQVLDTGVRPMAARSRDLDAKSLGKPRGGLKPLTVVQPEGPSFEIDGHHLRWQNWDLRFALNPREGLVLHAVGYEDAGRLRPVLHRASISEMIVPYGDPDVAWVWRAAFDEGEYGLGRLANELEPGRDAPANARFVDAVLAGEDGKPEHRANVLAVYERDGGLLWKHRDDVAGRSHLRRARQLVLLHAVTVGNYDYFIHWIFHQDGTIEVRAEASGILLAKGVSQKTCLSCETGKPAEGDELTGTLVAERVLAPNHQHFFSFRLDFDVDGPRNRLAEVNVSALPEGPANPHLNGFRMEKTPLKTELAARRSLDLAAHRHWKIYNADLKNALGHSPSYVLLAGENSAPYPLPGAASRKRAAFMEHHLWATAFRPGELYASGDYPNQNPGSEGLPKWTADDESIDGADLVVWYSVGLTHVPRPEEWPIMPTAGVGFRLAPSGFFLENPALDVPE
jgi:primary-amine oxidase